WLHTRSPSTGLDPLRRVYAIDRVSPGSRWQSRRHARCTMVGHPQEKEPQPMTTIDLATLAHVTGGVVSSSSSSSQLSTAVAGINSQLQSLTSQNNNNSSNSYLPLMIGMMAMNQKKSPAVVSAGGSTVVAG